MGSMVSIVLLWSLRAAVFSCLASGSPWDPMGECKPTLSLLNVWAALRPEPTYFFFMFFFSFPLFFLLYFFMTLSFVKLPPGDRSFWHQIVVLRFES